MAQYLCRNLEFVYFTLILQKSRHPEEEKNHLRCFYALFLHEFFRKCFEFYLARLPLSEQSSGKAKLYFYLSFDYAGGGMVFKAEDQC